MDEQMWVPRHLRGPDVVSTSTIVAVVPEHMARRRTGAFIGAEHGLLFQQDT